jgi:hypothetical protein
MVFKNCELLKNYYEKSFEEFILLDQGTERKTGLYIGGEKVDCEKLNKEYFILIVSHNIIIKLQKFLQCLSYMRCMPKKTYTFEEKQKYETAFKINSIRRKVMNDLFHQIKEYFNLNYM